MNICLKRRANIYTSEAIHQTIDNPLTHSHIDIEPTENQEFKLPHTLSSRLMNGITQEELEKSVQDLLKSYMLTKGASYVSFENAVELELATQWQSAPLHNFLVAAIQLKESHLFFEWTHFLKRKSISFPVNILIPLMEWALIDLAFARHVLQFLGPVGQQVAAQFPEFHILSEMHQAQPMQFSKLDQRLFAFEHYREQKPEAAFNYFMQCHQELKDAEKIKWLRILQFKLNPEEWNALQFLNNKKKALLHQELSYLQLKIDEPVFKNQQLQFLYYLSENSLDVYYSKISTTIAHAIRLSPLQFLSNRAHYQAYLKWIHERELFTVLLHTLKEQLYAEFAVTCFEYLLEHNLLNEQLPLGNLSCPMDHNSFNQCCIHWIETAQDAIDLEAFLLFIRHEKLFLKDEVLLKLVELRNSKVLLRMYDFSVFWQMLPYKINPFSEQIPNIPNECKMYLNSFVNFDTILQFRKGIRK